MIGKIEHTMAENIIDIVSDYYGVHKSKIHGKTRVWDVVHARQMACYMIRKYTNIPKLAIGRKYFGQDHSTIIHSIRVIESDIVTNNRGTKNDVRIISQAIEEQQSIKISKAQHNYVVLVKLKNEPDMYFGPWNDVQVANRMLQDKVKRKIDMKEYLSADIIKVTSIE
jgi:Bacterial dnaA protein helix-turn-helix